MTLAKHSIFPLLLACLLAAQPLAANEPAKPAETAGTPATKPAEPAAPAEKTEDKHHRLVIQVNQRDKEFQDAVLNNIVNLQKHYEVDNITIEVVAYGPGIWLVTEDSPHRKRVESLMLQNVTFVGCGNTLDSIEAKEKKRPKLIDGVELVQAGITQIIKRQEEGWSYLSP